MEAQLNAEPSADLLPPELEYLRESEEDLTQPESANVSTQSDCGQAAPSCAPSPPAPAPPAAPDTPQDVEELILQEWKELQKIRGAAARAAQIARSQAEKVARLTAKEENKKKTAFTTTGGNLGQVEPDNVVERVITWPPDARCVPADYDIVSHNAPVLHARAQRIEELGNYYFSTALTTTQRGKGDEDAIKEVAEKVGGYQNLAKTIRERIKKAAG